MGKAARKARRATGEPFYKAPKEPTPLLERSLNSRQVNRAVYDTLRELKAARLNMKES